MTRPEHLNCVNTAEGISRINEEQGYYDENPERAEREQRAREERQQEEQIQLREEEQRYYERVEQERIAEEQNCVDSDNPNNI